MRVIVSWSLRYRLIVLGIAAALMLAGYTLLSRASFDTLPEFGPPRVEVQTEALGLSAQEVEQLITVPLEADLLHGVAFLDEIHLAVSARPLVDRHVLRSGHGRASGAPDGRRTADAGTRPPERVEVAGDAPATVVVEPGDGGRRCPRQTCR